MVSVGFLEHCPKQGTLKIGQTHTNIEKPAVMWRICGNTAGYQRVLEY